jgi:hypothetical protein
MFAVVKSHLFLRAPQALSSGMSVTRAIAFNAVVACVRQSNTCHLEDPSRVARLMV